MKTTFVSTLGLASGIRNNLPRVQTELAKAGVEISTSRHADVGLALGNRTARTLSFRLDYSSLEGFIDSNNLLKTQLQRTQSTLQVIADGANSFLSTLVSVSGPAVSGNPLTQSAKSALSTFLGLGNTAGDGQYLLGGINSGEQPFADYSGAPKLALDTAFSTAFGLAMPDPQDDPAVANIDPAAMATFLDGAFADLFADPEWNNTWSSASSTNLSSRISENERIETSANANEPALRKLAMAYAMAAELGTDKLPAETLNVVVAKSRELLGSALADLSAMQSRIGLAEERVSVTNKRLALEKDLASKDITSLEGVDPVEAKVRFDTLSSQVEMSYALTTRILSLSILNYA